MKITIGRFIKKSTDYDSENILCPIKNYDRDKYLNRRLIIRVFFILVFGFGFGYSIFFNANSTIEIKLYFIKFILSYICCFYLIQIAHEFIHVLFYPLVFKNNEISLIFFNKKRLVTNEINTKINSYILFLSLITPFILFTIIPTLVILCSSFNIYLYSLSFANAILSSEDLLNIMLSFISPSENGYKRLFVIPNNYDYLIKYTNSSLINIDNNISENINEDLETDILDKTFNDDEIKNLDI